MYHRESKRLVYPGAGNEKAESQCLIFHLEGFARVRELAMAKSGILAPMHASIRKPCLMVIRLLRPRNNNSITVKLCRHGTGLSKLKNGCAVRLLSDGFRPAPIRR